MERAKEIAQASGVPGTQFTTVIRSLMRDEVNNEQKIGSMSSTMVERLCNSPSIAISLYFALKTFLPKVIEKTESLTVKELVNSFGAGELAAILASMYCYRSSRAKCSEEEWGFIGPFATEQVEIGGFLGRAQPKIGCMTAILAGTFRPLAFAAFCIADENKFIRYRKHLSSRGLFFDTELELEFWGCTYYEVGAYFLQSYGFGLPLARAYLQALEDHRSESPSVNDPSEMYLAFKYAALWIETLESSGRKALIDNPEYDIEDEFEVELLLRRSDKVNAKGSEFDWLERKRDELSAEVAPELFNVARYPKQWTLKNFVVKGKLHEEGSKSVSSAPVVESVSSPPPEVGASEGEVSPAPEPEEQTSFAFDPEAVLAEAEAGKEQAAPQATSTAVMEPMMEWEFSYEDLGEEFHALYSEEEWTSLSDEVRFLLRESRGEG